MLPGLGTNPTNASLASLHQEDGALLVSGVATARPVGERRPCCDSDPQPWLCLQPAFACPSTLLLPGGGALGTSDLKQHSKVQMYGATSTGAIMVL